MKSQQFGFKRRSQLAAMEKQLIMIKLFRNTRQRLLTENQASSGAGKFGKPAWPLGRYLTYAVGEIILVIIGILIALAINEQSKNKKNVELRDLYIIQLNDEADRNIKQLTEYENGASEMIKELDTLFQLLDNKEYDNPKLSLKAFVLLASNKLFTFFGIMHGNFV